MAALYACEPMNEANPNPADRLLAADSADQHLAAQYEAYPYPARDPRDEAKRLIVGSPGHLREVDHWVFGARRKRSLPLRALVAGGGTGDAAIMLAQQLASAGRPGHVTWLDRSEAALKIARARAEVRGLANIDFRLASLLDLPQSGLGPFDYIDCCGVLHHLPQPEAGLQALVSVLAPGGGLGLMVYAPHGRTGVYMLQDALRLLAPTDAPLPARLDMAKRALRHLPETAWLRRNPYFSDHIEGGDAGIYDLLLNPRDRAYDIQALFALLRSAGLAPTCLLEPARYDPALWLPDPKLRTRVAELDLERRAALAEALIGNCKTHVVYAVREDAIPAARDPADPDAVPVGRQQPGETLAAAVTPAGTVPMNFEGFRVPLPVPRLAAPLLRLVDGQRSVGEIGRAMADRLDDSGFQRAWQELWQALNPANQLLLVPPA
jgi:SAM-dependent methyltransferase